MLEQIIEKETKGNLMTTNARLISNSRSSYPTHADAVIAGVPSDLIVHTVDDLYCFEDDTIKCDGCDKIYADRHELDDDLNCEDCAQNAIDGEADLKSLNADWSASRGCDMGRGW